MSKSTFAVIQGQSDFPARWAGYCTAYGSAHYASGTVQGFNCDQGHFRRCQSGIWRAEPLTLSSLGVGTYLGDPDDATDENVENAVVRSVAEGWNVIDTAANYRAGRAEVAVGRALRALHLTGGGSRDQLFISTKAGYAPNRAILEELIADGVIDAKDVSGNACMHPTWLERSLARSLEALQLQTVDLFYLHNVAESFLGLIGRETFFDRLSEAFKFCEQARKDGKIRAYGLATWSCFRSPPHATDSHLSLKDVVDLAEKIGGEDHGFSAIQLPINTHMREAWEQKWQILPTASPQGEEDSHQYVSLIDAAQQLDVAVFSSRPIHQGIADMALKSALECAPEMDKRIVTHGSRLLQISRSTPGIQTSLAGQKSMSYVQENLGLSSVPPLSISEFKTLMDRIPG